MTAFGIFLFGVGAFLVWCAIKGEDPREVLRRTITKASPVGARLGDAVGKALPK